MGRSSRHAAVMRILNHCTTRKKQRFCYIDLEEDEDDNMPLLSSDEHTRRPHYQFDSILSLANKSMKRKTGKVDLELNSSSDDDTVTSSSSHTTETVAEAPSSCLSPSTTVSSSSCWFDVVDDQFNNILSLGNSTKTRTVKLELNSCAGDDKDTDTASITVRADEFSCSFSTDSSWFDVVNDDRDEEVMATRSRLVCWADDDGGVLAQTRTTPAFCESRISDYPFRVERVRLAL
jgi:hypothetical protein